MVNAMERKSISEMSWNVFASSQAETSFHNKRGFKDKNSLSTEMNPIETPFHTDNNTSTLVSEQLKLTEQSTRGTTLVESERILTEALERSFNKDLLGYLIFILFFMTLLLLAIAILRHTFQSPKRKRSTNNIARRRMENRRNVKKSESTKDYPISVISTSISSPTDLNYYYREPRRILWKSFYGSTEMPEIFNGIEREKSNSSDSTSTCLISEPSRSAPPNYTDVILLSQTQAGESLVGLPSYKEALQLSPNPIENSTLNWI